MGSFYSEPKRKISIKPGAEQQKADLINFNYGALRFL